MTTTNTLKTVLLLGLLSALLLVGGQALGGRGGLYGAMALVVIVNVASYFFSDRIALAMYQAQPVNENENGDVYRRLAPLVGNLCRRMELPPPRLWLIPGDSPNAFATGRDPAHSSVAVTEGILQVMDDREVEGVLAHELGHVLHRDILISSVAATIAGAITFLARMAMWGAMFGGAGRDDDDERGGALGFVLMAILAPVAAGFIQMAISRTREYDADAASAKYCGTPHYLINALRKLETWSKRIPMDVSPATAHMFIIQPFTGASFMRLFSTHPSTEERIARLQAIR
jgi:heat shock protein HtpX